MAYRVTTVGEVAPACTVRLQAEPYDIDRGEIPSDARDGLQKLQVALAGVRQSAGSCGSMQTHLRWENQIQEVASTALYRPWSLLETDSGGFESDDSGFADGTFEHDQYFLQQWGLTGVLEHQRQQLLLRQIEATSETLAQWWFSRGLAMGRARALARRTVHVVASIGIRFNMYDPFPNPQDLALRQAILERHSMQAIRRIGYQAQVGTGRLSREHVDSVLNVAVTYPEALDYLLTQGADGDEPNEFGKTPLMYAAQSNQVRAIRVLLAHGANPNKATITPKDTCFYTLSSSGVTALHYAVRYGSAETIRALLAGGAKVDARATTGYPLDWLLRYTDATSPSRNRRLQPEDVAMLKKLLQVNVDRPLAAIR